MVMSKQQRWQLRVGRAYDGGGGPATPDVLVTIDGERIAEVRPAAGEDVPHLPEAAVLPGLLDLHVHLNMRGDGRPLESIDPVSDGVLGFRSYAGALEYLRHGVTTVLDLGSRNTTALDLAEAVEEGTLVGPTVLASGPPVTRTGGHMWVMNGEADGVDGVRRAVRERAKAGAAAIKLVATGGATRGSSWFQPAYTEEEMRAAVAEAHAIGLSVAAHCTNSDGTAMAVRAGVDLLVHAFFYDADGAYRFRPDLAEAIVAHGASVNPTLYTVESRIRRAREISVLRQLTDPERAQLDADLRGLDERRDMVARLHEMGVPFVVGSDGGFTEVRHGTTAREAAALVAAGLSPVAALAAATGVAAGALGRGDLGALRAGARADLLLVDGDPGTDIDRLTDVVAVVRSGRLVHATDAARRVLDPHGALRP
jgi:imidazolonepropionase-like amidohydrolase